jgi:hypothetical protein
LAVPEFTTTFIDVIFVGVTAFRDALFPACPFLNDTFKKVSFKWA